MHDFFKRAMTYLTSSWYTAHGAKILSYSDKSILPMKSINLHKFYKYRESLYRKDLSPGYLLKSWKKTSPDSIFNIEK